MSLTDSRSTPLWVVTMKASSTIETETLPPSLWVSSKAYALDSASFTLRPNGKWKMSEELSAMSR